MYAPISSQVSAPSYEPNVSFYPWGVLVVQERSFCMDDDITVLLGDRGKILKRNQVHWLRVLPK